MWSPRCPSSSSLILKAEIDDGEGGHGSGSEADTKKSFDFTGELQKLNESEIGRAHV